MVIMIRQSTLQDSIHVDAHDKCCTLYKAPCMVQGSRKKAEDDRLHMKCMKTLRDLLFSGQDC